MEIKNRYTGKVILVVEKNENGIYDLKGADLTGAGLSEAILAGANLTGANLAWANLTGTIIGRQPS